MPDAQNRNITPNELREMDPTDRMKLGQEMYRRDILPRMTPADRGMRVVMDMASGDYEIALRSADARSRLEKRRPDAVSHMERVGAPFAAVSLRRARDAGAD